MNAGSVAGEQGASVCGYMQLSTLHRTIVIADSPGSAGMLSNTTSWIWLRKGDRDHVDRPISVYTVDKESFACF